MEKYLFEVIEKFFIRFLDINNFQFLHSESSSFACYNDFQNEILRIRILNDRGIIEVQIALRNSNDFIEIASIMQTEQISNKFGQGNRLFNLEEKIEFIKSKYELLPVILKNV